MPNGGLVPGQYPLALDSRLRGNEVAGGVLGAVTQPAAYL